MRVWKRRLITAAALALYLTACGARPTPTETATPAQTPAPIPTPSAPAAERFSTPEEELALAYLAEKYQCRAYTAANAPKEPEETDLRLDGLTYLGEEVIYETVGAAYALNVSRYFESRNEAGEKSLAWTAAEPSCLILERSGYDDAWQGVFGEARLEGRELSDVILETAWGLTDIEVSLYVDGYPQLLGPGADANFHFPGEEATAAVLADRGSLYAEGDEWRSYTYQNFEALCYYGTAEDRETIHRIVTSRSDVETHRGVRVGESREKVLEAYLEGLEHTYRDYTGDYLCCSGGKNDGRGAALLFWFENDTVAKLELVEASTPGPTPASPATYSGPVTDALESLLDGGRWTARFWIFPGSGPLQVELPEAEYGDALRALFAACDWKEIPYEQTQPGEDFTCPPDAYGVSFLPSRYSANGPRPMGIRSYEDYVYMETRTEEGYETRYFRAEGAETLCADIADLWPGWEALTGCRTRIVPQTTKEDTARAYLEAVFDRLKANGHIQDARIDSVEISSWTYDNDLGEMVESDDMSYDSSKSVLFRTAFSLRPTRPELSYWQEQGVDKDGWARFELGRISLSQWGDDEFCELDWFEYSRTAP